MLHVGGGLVLTWRRQEQQRRTLFLLSLLAMGLGLLLGMAYCGPPEPSPEVPLSITVQWPDGTQSAVELESFLVGVVAAEMPASFHPQALQAQAIAARTYVVRQQLAGKHGTAAVCCDSACCQAWRSKEDLEDQWGEAFSTYWAAVSAAVEATAGQVLTMDGQLIDAVFCSTCGGMTEDVEAVWGSPRSYLTAHTCAYCTHSPRYSGWQRFSLVEAAERLETTPDQIRQMKVLDYTPGGRVAAVDLGEQQWKGTEVRSRLGLDSAAFSWLIQGEELVVLTLGYGHGVGLCQYGADGMGDAGYTYAEILEAYYPGTSVGQAADFLLN